MNDPRKVSITGVATATVDLNCGPQKSSPVRVEYEAINPLQEGIDGVVRAIHFDK
jgi:hypothetical protein